jgi:MFS family permease
MQQFATTAASAVGETHDGEPKSSSSSSYQHVSFHDEEEEEEEDATSNNLRAAQKVQWNFITMSILFSANHGCVVSCLGLASARLGSIGAWQSGILYLFYTSSALLGATYITKRLGSRNSLFWGMLLYCFYVGCFWIAASHPEEVEKQRIAAYVGAAIGGVGAGFLWTAQGSYFASSSEDHAHQLQQSVSTSTSYFAGIFAFLYLTEEVLLRLLSSFLLEFHIASWDTIFAIYTTITIVSTIAIPCINNYPRTTASTVIDNANNTGSSITTIFYRISAALQLLVTDPKMKYMIGLNAVFGFTASFLNSYVNGQVLPVALNDPESKYVGILSSWVSAVAASMSLLFGRIGPKTGNGPILMFGSICFFGVVFPFVVQPNANKYGWTMLIFIYTCHG